MLKTLSGKNYFLRYFLRKTIFSFFFKRIIISEIDIFPHVAQKIAERCRNILDISLQLIYCRNIVVKYWKIFHRNITVLTF